MYENYVYSLVVSNQCPLCMSVLADKVAAQHHALNAIREGRCWLDRNMVEHRLIKTDNLDCPKCEYQAISFAKLQQHIRTQHIVAILPEYFYFEFDDQGSQIQAPASARKQSCGHGCSFSDSSGDGLEQVFRNGGGLRLRRRRLEEKENCTSERIRPRSRCNVARGARNEDEAVDKRTCKLESSQAAAASPRYPYGQLQSQRRQVDPQSSVSSECGLDPENTEVAAESRPGAELPPGMEAHNEQDGDIRTQEHDRPIRGRRDLFCGTIRSYSCNSTRLPRHSCALRSQAGARQTTHRIRSRFPANDARAADPAVHGASDVAVDGRKVHRRAASRRRGKGSQKNGGGVGGRAGASEEGQEGGIRNGLTLKSQEETRHIVVSLVEAIREGRSGDASGTLFQSEHDPSGSVCVAQPLKGKLGADEATGSSLLSGGGVRATLLDESMNAESVNFNACRNGDESATSCETKDYVQADDSSKHFANQAEPYPLDNNILYRYRGRSALRRHDARVSAMGRRGNFSSSDVMQARESKPKAWNDTREPRQPRRNSRDSFTDLVNKTCRAPK